MSYLIDTCVMSELSKPRPDGGVVGWMSEADPDSLHVSVITLGEIRRGVSRLAPGRRRSALLSWSERLRRAFSGRIVPVDEAVILRWADVAARAGRGGRSGSFVHGLIAATALDRGLTLVTRNAPHFEPFGVALLNPWTRS